MFQFLPASDLRNALHISWQCGHVNARQAACAELPKRLIIGGGGEEAALRSGVRLDFCGRTYRRRNRQTPNFTFVGVMLEQGVYLNPCRCVLSTCWFGQPFNSWEQMLRELPLLARLADALVDSCDCAAGLLRATRNSLKRGRRRVIPFSLAPSFKTSDL